MLHNNVDSKKILLLSCTLYCVSRLSVHNLVCTIQCAKFSVHNLVCTV